MVIVKYWTVMFKDNLSISLSQFVAIPQKALQVSFYYEKQSEMLQSYFYQRHTTNTEISDICRWVFSH